ncbi:MAG TPA: heavy metal-associated domain-containing protein [Atribacteraceae bacterium]|nr:heavy metal-associated domain-containing protein [Atribacteraceae bacterium]
MKLKIDGMSCQHCVTRLKKELEQVDGVVSVNIDLKTGVAEFITAPPVRTEILVAVVEKAGYHARPL